MMNKALSRALALIADGTLSVDPDGAIWRHRAEIEKGEFPRRAESIGGKGYFRLMLWIDGRLCGVGAHRVVWAHANGKRTIPNGKQINHIDSNKRNNRPANLELVSQSQNIQHSYSADRPRPWNTATEWRPGRTRLTNEQIADARRLRASGLLIREVADRIGISVTHAHRITA